MNPSDPTQGEGAGCGVARAKKQYQPPAFKELGLADVPIAERSTPAHELNNDLAIIFGECDLLADLLVEETDAFSRVQVIKTAATRMAERISARPSPAAVSQHDAR